MEKVKRKPRKWTEEEIETAKSLYESGMNFEQIGRELKRHSYTVGIKLKSLGYKAKRTQKQWEQNEINEALELYNEGKNYVEIGKIINREPVSVRVKLNSLGVVKSIGVRNNFNEKEINKMVRLYNEGYTPTEIGKRLNRDKSSVSKKLIELGIHKPTPINSVSLWDIEHLRIYIIDVDESKITTSQNSKKIKVKCTCGREKKIRVSDFVNHGIACPTCSKGTSYPELFMLAYLTVKNIPHETQVSYKEIPTRSYDFRIKLNGVTSLVETHGSQHFLTEDKGYHKVETIQESDSIKRQYAKNNNINYIELDCCISSFEFIRKQIENNEYLPNIEDSEVDAMLEVIEQNRKYPVREIKDMYLKARKSTVEIAEHYGYDHTTINRILRRNNVDLRDANASLGKKVRCIETGKIYDSTHEASRQLNIQRSSISKCCLGKQKSAGGFTFKHLSATEENAHHRASLVSQQDKLDTIELDSSDHMLDLFNNNKEKV